MGPFVGFCSVSVSRIKPVGRQFGRLSPTGHFRYLVFSDDTIRQRQVLYSASLVPDCPIRNGQWYRDRAYYPDAHNKMLNR
jgi:hypothetical protein